NRTPPKTQSALLEAMQERQVTIDGVSHVLEPEFFVMATENPVEFEGTYPLPEAQLDRFLLKIDMGVPEEAAEIELYRRAVGGVLGGWGGGPMPEAMLSAADAGALRGASRTVHVAPELMPYLAALARAVRRGPRLRPAGRHQEVPRPLLGPPHHRSRRIGAGGSDSGPGPPRSRQLGRGA